jgi:hypothetical protein
MRVSLLSAAILGIALTGCGSSGMQLTKNAKGGEFYFNPDGGTRNEAPCSSIKDEYARQMCIGNHIQAKGLQLQQFQVLQGQMDRTQGQMDDAQRNPVQHCPTCE